MKLTPQTYASLQKSFDHFNKELFGDKLPQVLITLAAHKTAYGYHRPDAIMLSDDKKAAPVSEISLKKSVLLQIPFSEIRSSALGIASLLPL